MPTGARIVSAALLALSSALVAMSAVAQTAGDPRLPSFKDERRFGPRAAPASSAPATESAKATPPASAAPATPGQAPLLKAATPAAAAPPAAPPPPTPAQKAAATAPANPAIKKLAPGACGTPDVKTESLGGGRMRVAITSSCRGGQDIAWSYGGAEHQGKLDPAGKLELVVDAFAGTGSPVDLTFADGTHFALPVVASDLDRVTKVALIWRGAVDLDLHAFEYAVPMGGAGHVWSGAPATLDAARKQAQSSPRGTGSMTTLGKGAEPRDKLEVYTFVHRDGQAAGLVTLAVDHATRGEKPTAETCGNGANAEIAFRLVMLTRGGQPVVTRGAIAAAPCDAPLEARDRLDDTRLPPIRIRAAQ